MEADCVTFNALHCAALGWQQQPSSLFQLLYKKPACEILHPAKSLCGNYFSIPYLTSFDHNSYLNIERKSITFGLFVTPN